MFDLHDVIILIYKQTYCTRDYIFTNIKQPIYSTKVNKQNTYKKEYYKNLTNVRKQGNVVAEINVRVLRDC